MVNLILQVSVYHVCSLQNEWQGRSLREREREVAISHTAHEKEWAKRETSFGKLKLRKCSKLF